MVERVSYIKAKNVMRSFYSQYQDLRKIFEWAMRQWLECD